MEKLELFESRKDIIECMNEKVITPLELRNMHPMSEVAKFNVERNRIELIDILSGRDDRMLVIVGPCSLDDSILETGQFSFLKYVDILQKSITDLRLDNRLKIILRAPPLKPRSDLGQRGLEQNNLELAHLLLTTAVNQNMSIASELQTEKHFARYGDMLTLGWAGARDVSSTLLRHAVSGHPELPFLFKNGPTGSMDDAIRAIKTASSSHIIEKLMPDNTEVNFESSGNSNIGLIYRGGDSNNSLDFIENTTKFIENYGGIVDCSHSNAMAHDVKKMKSVSGQLACIESIEELIIRGKRPKGIMIESYLLEGSGDLPGQSKTDPCINIENTLFHLDKLAKIV